MSNELDSESLFREMQSLGEKLRVIPYGYDLGRGKIVVTLWSEDQIGALAWRDGAPSPHVVFSWPGDQGSVDVQEFEGPSKPVSPLSKTLPGVALLLLTRDGRKKMEIHIMDFTSPVCLQAVKNPKLRKKGSFRLENFSIGNRLQDPGKQPDSYTFHMAPNESWCLAAALGRDAPTVLIGRNAPLRHGSF